jgi:hypothetical protein
MNKIYYITFAIILLVLTSFIIIEKNYNLREDRCQVLETYSQMSMNGLIQEPTGEMDLLNYESCFTHKLFDLTPYYKIYALEYTQVQKIKCNVK